jgi:flagellar basal body rod protein FlgG
MQGALEGSNVEPIVEISRLIGSQHNVEYAKTFVDALAQQTSNAIDRLGKAP